MTNRNSQSYLAPLPTHRAQSWGTGAQNGGAIDCLRYRQAAFHVHVGVIGASATVDYKIQESADGSTNWTDVAGAATAQIIASDTGARISVDCRKRLRYLRAVLTVAVQASIAYGEAILHDPIDSNVPTDAYTWVSV